MFLSVTMESAVFMGKNVQNNRNSIVNTEDLTLKQMFDMWQNKMRSGLENWLGETFMEISVIDW